MADALMAALLVAATVSGAPPPSIGTVLRAPPVEIVDQFGNQIARITTFNDEERALAQSVLFRANQELSAHLFNYGQARFRGVVAQFRDRATSGVSVCGQVNAMNRLGGYVGWQDFSYVNGRLDVGPADSSVSDRCRLTGGFVDSYDYSGDMGR